jgi:hypothetical protein
VADYPSALEPEVVEHFDCVFDMGLDRKGLAHRRRGHASLLVAKRLENIAQLLRERFDVFARKSGTAVEDERRGPIAQSAANDRTAGDLDGE